MCTYVVDYSRLNSDMIMSPFNGAFLMDFDNSSQFWIRSKKICMQSIMASPYTFADASKSPPRKLI
jgi:hypothetical protein